MITPEEIRKKALRHWNNQNFLKADLSDDSFFPLQIPFGKKPARQMLADFVAMRAWSKALRQQSKEVLGYGYRIDYKTVKHRTLGDQRLPDKIVIESKADFLKLIGKEHAYQRFRENVTLISATLPCLAAWIEKKPLTVIKYDAVWPGLLSVCRFFQQHPKPDRYLRELDIAGVDTKFIEQHYPVLDELLSCILPENVISFAMARSTRYRFEQRFHLKYDSPLIRFKILDPSLAQRFGLCDISTPITEFNTLQLACNRVFITENKINGLSFPHVANAIVIFGLGYGVQSLQEVAWLKNQQIMYWGDIDTHGFAMLSMLRGYFPQTRSLMMDEETLLQFKQLWVNEPPHSRTTADLKHLTPVEQTVYDRLRNDTYAENVRLEQERIAFGHVCRMLQRTV